MSTNCSSSRLSKWKQHRACQTRLDLINSQITTVEKVPVIVAAQKVIVTRLALKMMPDICRIKRHIAGRFVLSKIPGKVIGRIEYLRAGVKSVAVGSPVTLKEISMRCQTLAYRFHSIHRLNRSYSDFPDKPLIITSVNLNYEASLKI